MQLQHFKEQALPVFSDKNLWTKLTVSHSVLAKEYENLRREAVTRKPKLILDFARAFIHGFFTYEGCKVDPMPHEIDYIKAAACLCVAFSPQANTNTTSPSKNSQQKSISGLVFQCLTNFVDTETLPELLAHVAGVNTPSLTPSQLKKLLPCMINVLGEWNYQRDLQAATKLFQKAAESGDPAGMNNFATQLENGNPFVKQDQELAAEYYHRAAAQYHIPAMINSSRYIKTTADLKPQDFCLKALLYRVLQGDVRTCQMLVIAMITGDLDWNISLNTESLKLTECRFKPLFHIDVILDILGQCAQLEVNWALDFLLIFVDKTHRSKNPAISDIIHPFIEKKEHKNYRARVCYLLSKVPLSVKTFSGQTMFSLMSDYTTPQEYYFKEALKADDPNAFYEHSLQKMACNEFFDIDLILEKHAKKHPHMTLMAARARYHRESGVPSESFEQCAALLQQGNAQSILDTLAPYGMCLLFGIGTQQKPEQALRIFTHAATQHQGDAFYFLGYIAEKQNKDPNIIFELYHRGHLYGSRLATHAYYRFSTLHPKSLYSTDEKLVKIAQTFIAYNQDPKSYTQLARQLMPHLHLGNNLEIMIWHLQEANRRFDQSKQSGTDVDFYYASVLDPDAYAYLGCWMLHALFAPVLDAENPLEALQSLPVKPEAVYHFYQENFIQSFLYNQYYLNRCHQFGIGCQSQSNTSPIKPTNWIPLEKIIKLQGTKKILEHLNTVTTLFYHSASKVSAIGMKCYIFCANFALIEESKFKMVILEISQKARDRHKIMFAMNEFPHTIMPYFHYLELTKNYKDARLQLEKAVECGGLEAREKLIQYYREGIGGDKNPEAANRLAGIIPVKASTNENSFHNQSMTHIAETILNPQSNNSAVTKKN